MPLERISIILMIM